jgi:uncharacterized protein
MKRAIIIHGWGQKPNQEWLPWLAKNLQKEGWNVSLPEMPNTDMPKLSEWMKLLQSLKPDIDTVLIGHSLGNALILKYLETENIKVKGVYLVAAWDYLLPDLKKEHKTFFETGFDYETIKKTKIPITIIQSTNDPYLDFDKAKILAKKIGAKFIPVKNAGHFMERNGYKQFPLLQKLVLS